jgi:K+-transporting ATPase KdpF subunit
LKGDLMLVLTAVVTLLLFVYLLAALLRPEWF